MGHTLSSKLHIGLQTVIDGLKVMSVGAPVSATLTAIIRPPVCVFHTSTDLYYH